MPAKRRQRQGPGFGESGGTNMADYMGLTEQIEEAERQTEAAEDIVRVPVKQIDHSPYQARIAFDSPALKALAEDIKEHGLNHPITLRPKPDGRYELLAGERRWRAAELGGMDRIDARIRNLDDFSAHLVGVSENNQRADLSPWERALEARELQQHAAETGQPHTQRDLARYLNRNVAIVNQQLTIADALSRDVVGVANVTGEDMSRLPHETLHRIAKLSEIQRYRALKEAARRYARRAKDTPRDRSPAPSGGKADRWTRLWEHGGFRVQIKSPLRTLEPAKAQKYLENLLPGIGGLAARAAEENAESALVQWEHEQGQFLFLRPPRELTAERRHAVKEALTRMIEQLDAAE